MKFQSLVVGIYGQTARQVIAQYPAANLTFPQTDPTGVYAPGCAIFGTATLTAADFWTPLAYQHIAVADNEGPGNVTTGIADLAYYYKLLSARNSSHASTSSRQAISVH